MKHVRNILNNKLCYCRANLRWIGTRWVDKNFKKSWLNFSEIKIKNVLRTKNTPIYLEEHLVSGCVCCTPTRKCCKKCYLSRMNIDSEAPGAPQRMTTKHLHRLFLVEHIRRRYLQRADMNLCVVLQYNSVKWILWGFVHGRKKYIEYAVSLYTLKIEICMQGKYNKNKLQYYSTYILDGILKTPL